MIREVKKVVMNKEEILKKLKELNLDREKYIVINNASLVVQGFLDDTKNIDLCCCKSDYEKLNWKEKLGTLGVEIKYKDQYQIDYTLYDPSHILLIDGFQFADLEHCYKTKQLENKKENKKILEKLDLYLCSKDNDRYERKLRSEGIHLIAGVDEVGRGPLVGPVVAACVILPHKFDLEGLTDSKKLSEKKREEYYQKIIKQALAVGVGVIDEKKIDEVNIYEATKLAMKEAINHCNIIPEHILIDAMKLDIDIPTTSIIKGDLKSITISAASVIAKVVRDHMMYDLDKKYPIYDFKNNKGYPTKKHLDAIDEYGILKEHRKSYAPVRNYLEEGCTRV